MDRKKPGIYPNQYVCLVDIVRAELRSPEILLARVVGHGATDDEAFEPIRELGGRYPRCAIRYTGESAVPLTRPSFDFDEEDLELLRSSPRADARRGRGRRSWEPDQRARLVVDTGAAATTLTPGLVERVGYRQKDGYKDARVHTAIGEELGYWLRIAQLDVLGIATPNIDGLVGMDFLRHSSFEVRLDEQRILVELVGRT